MDDKEKAAEEVKDITESKDVDSKEVDKTQADSKDNTQAPKQRKNKKVIYGIVSAIVVLIVCIGLYTFMDQQRKQEILDNIQITFVEDLEIEYGEQDYDFSQLVKEKSDEVTLPDKIDTMILGEKEVIFTVEKEGLHKEFPIKVKVTDTKAPEIALKEDVVTLEYESDYDIKENIESVKDPVDGDISFAESAGENNYYVVEGTINTSTAGEYTITVKAVDKNQISSEKAFTIYVNEKEEVQAPKQSQTGGNKPPVSNNGAGSSNSGASNPPVQPNGIGSVINTAYSFVGGSMSCNDVVIKSYQQNGYQVSDSAYYLGNSVGTNVDNLIAGDVIVLSGHVMLVVSKNGTDIIVIEGGVNGNNVEVTNCVGQGNLFYHNGVAERQVIDIRRY